MVEKIFVRVSSEGRCALIGPFANASSAYYEKEKVGGEIVRLVVEV